MSGANRTMRRVPVNFKQAIYYPTPEQHERLRTFSFEKKIPMSELIRQAIDEVYPDGEQKEGKEGK